MEKRVLILIENNRIQQACVYGDNSSVFVLTMTNGTELHGNSNEPYGTSIMAHAHDGHMLCPLTVTHHFFLI